MLISLLIKYICRYLPYEREETAKETANKDLFKIISIKNNYLPENIKKELSKLTNDWGIQVKNAIDFTQRIVSMIKTDVNKKPHNLNESFISYGGESTNQENDSNDIEDDNDDDDDDDERDF